METEDRFRGHPPPFLTLENVKQQLESAKPVGSIPQGKFEGFYIGNNIWVWYYKETSDRSLSLSGSTDTLQLDVPFNFRLCKIIFISDDTTAKDLIAELVINRLPRMGYNPRLFGSLDDQRRSISVKYGEGYEFELLDAIKIKVTGTATKKFWAIIYTQKIG